jgi:hypothetical protein
VVRDVKTNHVRLVDAGVEHTAGRLDPELVKATVDRIVELSGGQPIDVMVSHVHLDHIGVLSELSKRVEIRSIQLNAVQLLDPRFNDVAGDIGTNRQKLIEDRIRKEVEGQREAWMKDWAKNKMEPNEGKRESDFKEYVEKTITEKLAQVEPIRVEMLTPAGAVVDTSSVKVGRIVRKDLAAGDKSKGEGFMLEGPGGAAIVDPGMAEVLKAQQEKLALPREKQLLRNRIIDAQSTAIVVKLSNGNRLIAVPDARVPNWAAIQASLAKALLPLDPGVQFQIWDFTHHLQVGFSDSDGGDETKVDAKTEAKVDAKPGDTAAAKPDAPKPADAGKVDAAKAEGTTGLTRVSQLLRMSEILYKLKSGMPNTANVAVVSADVALIDPAVVWFLRSMGYQVTPAVNKQEVKIIEAVAARGTKISGVTAGKDWPGLHPDEPLLEQSHAALEKLKADREELQRDLAEAKKDVEAKKAEDAKARKEAVDDRRDVKGKLDRARAGLTPDEREMSPSDFEEALAAKTQEIADLEAKVPKKVGKGAADAALRAQKKLDLAKLKALQKERTALADKLDRSKRIEDLTPKAESAEAAVKAFDDALAPLEAERDRIAGQEKAVGERIDRIVELQRKYIAEMQSISNSPKDPKPSVAPPEGKKSPFAETEAALRAEIQGAAKTVSKRTLGTISDTAVVVLGGKAVTPSGQALEKLLAAAKEARDKLPTSDHALRDGADLVTKLRALENALVEEVGKTPGASEIAFNEELEVIRSEIAVEEAKLKGAADKVEGTVERVPGSKAQVTTKVIPEQRADPGEAEKAPPAAGKPKSKLAESTEKAAARGGQIMGAVMVVQNITGIDEAAQRFSSGKAGLGEFSVAAAKSALGVTIGARMALGAPVGMGQFVVLSALDITESVLRQYDSTEEKDAAIAYAALRNGVSLALAGVGQAMMATGHPLGIAAGFAIMFVGDPILEALGAHDWLAKKFSFMPDENIEVEQDLQKLLKDYSVIIGAMELAARSDPKLAEVGVKDPTALRTAARKAIDDRRGDVQFKEREILHEIEAAYARARSGYAGMREIDVLRRRFLDLYIQAHQGDTAVDAEPNVKVFKGELGNIYEYGVVTRKEIEKTFARTEKQLAKDTMSEADVDAMEQWTKLDKKMSDLKDEVYGEDSIGIDWMKISEIEHEIGLMLKNAHYRLDPRAQGDLRTEPMFSPGTAARRKYEIKLTVRETMLEELHRFTIGRATGSESGPFDKIGGGRYEPKPDYSKAGKLPVAGSVVKVAADGVFAYEQVLITMPALPNGITADQIYESAAGALRYQSGVQEDGEYKEALYKLRAAESAAAALVDRAGQVVAEGASPEEKKQLDKARADLKKLSQTRRNDGYLYITDELPALIPKITAATAKRVAGLMGEAGSVTPLSENEAAAAKSKRLEPPAPGAGAPGAGRSRGVRRRHLPGGRRDGERARRAHRADPRAERDPGPGRPALYPPRQGRPGQR